MKILPGILLVGAVGLVGPASAGVVMQYAPNYVALSATADTSFAGGVVDVGPHGADFATAAPPFEPHPPYRNTVSAASTLAPASTSDPLKDEAKGTVTLTFDPGAAGVADTFSVTFFGSASALSAFASDGSPASANVALKGFAEFFLDANYAGVPAGSLVGSLAIPALPVAGSFESFSITVLDNGLGVALLGPGAAGSVPLYAGHGYQISAKYNMAVPNGSDPPFDVSVVGSLIPAIPEPETYALMLAGLGLLGAVVRRAKRGAIVV